ASLTSANTLGNVPHVLRTGAESISDDLVSGTGPVPISPIRSYPILGNLKSLFQIRFNGFGSSSVCFDCDALALPDTSDVFSKG
ncbi:hypothetical protein GWI33_001772, partial [Rhynchophorus ferrugineus]